MGQSMECLAAEECARELCAGMDASTGAARPNPEQLARLVLVTCERLVSMMVEKVTTSQPLSPSLSFLCYQTLLCGLLT